MTAQGRLPLSPFIERLRPLLSAEPQPVYLVGGTVRDALLGRPIHDIDLTVADRALPLTFRLANALGLPAYVLDADRDVGRIVVPGEDLTLDIARYRGSTLEDDLRGRDFTINAMAMPISGQVIDDVIDFHGGQSDLHARRVRQIHQNSLADDPVRVLRAARFATQFGFKLTDDTLSAARAAAPLLPSRSSPERIRDELSRLLAARASHKGIDQLQELGALSYVLPEVSALVGIAQPPPHHEDVYRHTLSVLRWMVQINALVQEQLDHTAETWPADVEGLISPYRHSLQNHLTAVIDGGIPAQSLLMWGALLHDIGKAVTQTVEADGRIRFLGHDEQGAIMAGKLLASFSFSNEARLRGRNIVAGHMRPLFLANDRQIPSRRTVYRYFRDLGPAGIEVALLSIADHLATYEGSRVDESWESLRAVLDSLLDTYFNGYKETIAPPRLLDGREIMNELGLSPGQEIGRIVRLLEEAQAAGEVVSRAEALAFIHRISPQKKRADGGAPPAG